MWTNFSKYSNPTPNDGSLPFVWNQVQRNENSNLKIDYLDINNDTIEMKSEPDNERVQFWKEAFNRWNGSFLNPKL